MILKNKQLTALRPIYVKSHENTYHFIQLVFVVILSFKQKTSCEL